MLTADGIARRMRALAAMGHPDTDVATWLGVTVAQVRHLQSEGTADTALSATLGAVFERESMRVGRCGLTRQRARNAGWRTALAWDEHEIDMPDAGPDAPTTASGADVAQAAADALIQELAGKGWSDARIGQLLRVGRQAVLRRRAALGIPAGAAHRRATA